MAIKKSTPKPPRPGSTRSTANPTGRGSRKGTKVRLITKVTKPLTKPTVKNPSAPKGVGSGAAPGSVRVITKSESFLKREKAMRERSGRGRSQNSSSYSKTTTIPRGPGTLAGYPVDDSKKYKRDGKGSANQTVRGTDARYGASFVELRKRDETIRSAAGKGNKPTKITPKKKAEAPKKAAPKRRLFTGRGRGGGGGGGIGGIGGGLPDYNR
jgi:hypothetical protein